MTGQIQLWEELTIYDPADVFSSAPGHNRNTHIVIPASVPIVEDEITSLLPDDFVPIYLNWPVGRFEEEIGDFYKYLKPRQIGLFEVTALVKENENWVLHGGVMWGANGGVNHALLTRPVPVIQSVDIERGDPSKGRRAIRIDRLMVDRK